MPGQATTAQIHRSQDKKTKATGQENSSQWHQISHKPGNQVPEQEEATSQPVYISLNWNVHMNIMVCGSIYKQL
jgi:hypothetical protein